MEGADPSWESYAAYAVQMEALARPGRLLHGTNVNCASNGVYMFFVSCFPPFRRERLY